MKRIIVSIIIRFAYEHLRNETHVAYHTDAIAIIEKYNPETLGIQKLYPAYKARYEEEVLALDQILSSLLTEDIDRLDRERDSLWRGFDGRVKADLRHFDPERQRSAHHVYKILEHYGNIAEKTLKDETTAIEDLHRELLKQENFVHVAALGLGDWLGQLVQTSRNLDAMMMMRVDETGKRPHLNMRTSRTGTDKSYRGILDLTEALVRVNGDDTNRAFIDELNALSEYYKDILAQEEGRRHHIKDLSKGDHCVVEPVATQQYTEKAVTPIPKAFWREEGKPTVELVFAKDFYVTYKNNINVGTADLVLHGKGDYKGRFDVKFNIAR
jgi:hypothetical protein